MSVEQSYWSELRDECQALGCAISVETKEKVLLENGNSINWAARIPSSDVFLGVATKASSMGAVPTEWEIEPLFAPLGNLTTLGSGKAFVPKLEASAELFEISQVDIGNVSMYRGSLFPLFRVI